MNQFTQNKSLVLVATLATFFLMSCAGGDSTPAEATSNNSNNSNAHSQSSQGVPDYYQLYSSIASTKVFVSKVKVLTVDGDLIQVPFTPALVDLTDLSGFFKGIPVDLTNITISGETSIDIVEVQLYTADKNGNAVTFNDNEVCDIGRLKDGLIALTTPQPINLELGVLYRFEVANFSNFESVQFTCDKSRGHHKFPFWKFDKKHRHNHNCHHENDEKECELKCDLANRRQPITKVKVAADEA